MYCNYRIHNCKSILHPAIRTVGNITTSTDEHTQKIIDLQSLPILKSLLNHELLAIKKESCWALSNITAGTLAQKQVNNNIYLHQILILYLKGSY